MSAETLRRAAALMRERAEGATPATGGRGWIVDVGDPYACDNEVYSGPLSSESRDIATAFDAQTATHIASWHPAVAFAVADWLTVVADRFDALLDTFAPGSSAGAVTAAENVTGWQEALAVAQAYLGENQSFRPERGAE